jgi:hypothetical protein
MHNEECIAYLLGIPHISTEKNHEHPATFQLFCIIVVDKEMKL